MDWHIRLSYAESKKWASIGEHAVTIETEIFLIDHDLFPHRLPAIISHRLGLLADISGTPAVLNFLHHPYSVVEMESYTWNQRVDARATDPKAIAIRISLNRKRPQCQSTIGDFPFTLE